eukprot:1485523-Amphidinium_carterae.2
MRVHAIASCLLYRAQFHGGGNDAQPKKKSEPTSGSRTTAVVTTFAVATFVATTGNINTIMGTSKHIRNTIGSRTTIECNKLTDRK